MSKTARLFRLMDALRGRRRPVTAAQLATQLSVSVRTIYRDMQALIDLGASIDGSAGVGYLLRSGFFLPPLMFDDEELEALVLGARWVQQQGDPGLAQAAAAALARVAAAGPRELRERIADTGLWAPRFRESTQPSPVLALLRQAIRQERRLQIRYTDAAAATTERMIWPIALAFFDGTQVVAAWCELRADFRHFRTDRIHGPQPTSTPFGRPRHELVKLWRTLLTKPVTAAKYHGAIEPVTAKE